MNNICKNILRSQWLPSIQQCTSQKCRQIYNAAGLGLLEYQNVRDRYKNLNTDNFQSFRQKMEEIQASQSNADMIFTEDLKQFVHIVENDHDMNVFESLLAKYNKQNKHLRFSSFVFGPVIMRMYYYLNKPKEALHAYLNPQLDGLFDELTSHIVLFDLLFNNKMYQELVDVYILTREKQYTFGKYPKTLIVPLFGALYKLNTLESYKYMLTLLKGMEESGSVPIRRALCFAAALAFNQNNPHVALELLSTTQNPGFFIVRSIKALATCALDQIDETLIILASVLTIDTPTKNNHDFPKDVIEYVRKHIEKMDRKDHTMEFNRVIKQLESFGHISDATLDDVMCSEYNVFNPVNQMKTIINASLHNTPQVVKRIRKISRPGLQEML